MTDSGAEVMDLLLSITSTSIRRVSIVHKPLTPTYRVNWRGFDGPLCQLVDKSGGKHEVEVDFRFKDARAVERSGLIDRRIEGCEFPRKV